MLNDYHISSILAVLVRAWLKVIFTNEGLSDLQVEYKHIYADMV